MSVAGPACEVPYRDRSARHASQRSKPQTNGR